jgi:anoctamin-10
LFKKIGHFLCYKKKVLGLITFLWGVLFLRFWQRHEHRLANKWGTYSLSLYERQKYFAIRPEFCGYLRKSPVTGMIETYYPPIRRRLKYVVSAVASSVLLWLAFAVMILFLNLQGYIRPKSNPKRWNDSNPHPFHVQAFAALAEEGRPFDATSAWRSLIPVVLHVFCIFTLNNIYRVVAGALTAWENHETALNHRNSLVLKRFLFEAFDCYVALFYLAFYERNVDRLRAELIAVFQIDTFRRVLLECIVPMLLQRLGTKLSRTQEQRGFLRTGPSKESIDPTECTLLEDLEKDEYEQFDDFMEIVIQLGYVSLFASAYPLASLISIAANWVEIRSDCFKLTKVCRRPASFRSSGIGMWKALMACVIWTSALTNCLIAGFTSGQLTHYLPNFYNREENGYNIDSEDGWLVAFVIFGLERLLLLAGLLIFAVVPAVPEDVADELERRHYVRKQQRALATASDKKKD